MYQDYLQDGRTRSRNDEEVTSLEYNNTQIITNKPTMTAGTPNPADSQPPVWDGTQQVPPSSLKLWKEVGEGLDKSQTGE